MLIDDNRLFTKRQLFQTNGELTFHASANLTLEDNYAVTANAKIDFIEAMDAGKITLNDSWATPRWSSTRTPAPPAPPQGANVVGDGSPRFKDGQGLRPAGRRHDPPAHQRRLGGRLHPRGHRARGNASLNVPLKVDDITETGTTRD